jgi:hypothetical protein
MQLDASALTVNTRQRPPEQQSVCTSGALAVGIQFSGTLKISAAATRRFD